MRLDPTPLDRTRLLTAFSEKDFLAGVYASVRSDSAVLTELVYAMTTGAVVTVRFPDGARGFQIYTATTGARFAVDEDPNATTGIGWTNVADEWSNMHLAPHGAVRLHLLGTTGSDTTVRFFG